MLYIDIATASDVTVTLREKSVGATPSYTWKIVDQVARKEYIFTADNNSTSPYYDCFTLSVYPGITYGATAGLIPATRGEYQYYIYEMPTAYDLDLDNAVKLVETGILNIVGTFSEVITNSYRRTSITTNNKY